MPYELNSFGAIARNRAKTIQELVGALEDMLKAHKQLMPGIAHIAVEDYANINEAPIRALKAIALAKAEK